MRIILILSIFLFIFACSGPVILTVTPMFGKKPRTVSERFSDSLSIERELLLYKTPDSAAYRKFQTGSALTPLDVNAAMNLFNLAWLLDSSSAYPYWGFALALEEGKAPLDTVIAYYRMARQFDDTTNELLIDNGLTYGRKAKELRKTGDSSWTTYRDSSLALFSRISRYSKKECWPTLKQWECALGMKAFDAAARIKDIVDSTGIDPNLQHYYDIMIKIQTDSLYHKGDREYTIAKKKYKWYVKWTK